jgi:hypothetical protein
VPPDEISKPAVPAVYRGRHANANALKTHCVHNHEFTADNTYYDRHGYRSCVTCRDEVAERVRKENEGDPMDTMTRPLNDVDFRGLVRDRDPETSWTAANLQTNAKSHKLHRDILWILRTNGPLTDDQIAERYLVLVKVWPMFYDWATPQSLRTRRSEMVHGTRGSAVCVVATGEKRASANNGPSKVWAAL